MPTITVESPIVESPRVAQVRGLFDLAPSQTSRSSWNVALPLEDRPWHVGLITGPSGSGKSTIARHLWAEQVRISQNLAWPADRAVVDAFPGSLSIKDIVALLSSVGFSSPPAWLRPFGVLSTGQQFRVTLARLLALALAGELPGPIVCDEFTSVVDRTVARIGSAALARTARSRGLSFVAVSCHDDIIDWLQPDWVYRADTGELKWRLLRRRPSLHLDLERCGADLWPIFAPHHYLNHALAPSAVCFVARLQDRPVCFSAWLPFVGSGPAARREHRTVTLPDFQGAGIGRAVTTTIAALWRGLGYRAVSTTTHPALVASRQRSPFWVLRRAPSLAARSREKRGLRHAATRLTAGFEYTGPALPERLALLLRGG